MPGRGLLHAERPFGPRHGLQMWTTLPPALKQSEPIYRSFPAAAVPEIARDGARIRIVAGTIDGTTGPATFATPTLFVHVSLQPDAAVALDAGLASELGAYVLAGAADVGGTILRPGTLGIFGAGETVRLAAAGSAPVELALFGGAPAQGEILFGGPFVMDTPERLAGARADFLSGRMGRLDGVPH